MSVTVQRDLTIVMYHYVRAFANSRYPLVKGLDMHDFKAQLTYVNKHYHPVTMEEVIHSINTGDSLPPHAILLTFDDGYLDHYLNVFPLLHDMGMQGSFFAPVAPVRDHKLLDVNRIHFILATSNNPAKLRQEIDERLHENRKKYSLLATEAYWEKYAQASRFDNAETMYVKRMLQVALPEQLRNQIAQELFSNYVARDEAEFASDLYLNVDQLKMMQRCGMYIGSHGTSHCFMNAVDRERQTAEVDESLSFLRAIGSPVEHGWVMCYPYGAWNESLLEVLRSRGCAAGITIEMGIANLDKHDKLLLPRKDTNDLPKASRTE